MGGHLCGISTFLVFKLFSVKVRLDSSCESSVLALLPSSTVLCAVLTRNTGTPVISYHTCPKF